MDREEKVESVEDVADLSSSSSSVSSTVSTVMGVCGQGFLAEVYAVWGGGIVVGVGDGMVVGGFGVFAFVEVTERERSVVGGVEGFVS